METLCCESLILWLLRHVVPLLQKLTRSPLTTFRFTVKPLQAQKTHVVSPKGIALIVLCLKTFGLAMGRPVLWPSVLVSDWCRLMCAIVTAFTDDKARQAVDCCTWLLEKLDDFDDAEMPSLAVFAPLQVALQSALQENLTCAKRCGKIGSPATSLLTRFFLVYDKMKGRIAEKFCKANMQSKWKTNCTFVSKEENSLQVNPPPLLKSLLRLK